MRSFLRFIIRNPMAVILAAAAMSLGGIYSARHMPVDLFPDLNIPVVNIITHDPGAAPEEMERLVSRPIEDAVRSIVGVKRVASISVQGISRVTVEFTRGTTVRDARQLIQARLGRVGAALPAGVIPRLESIGTTLQEVCGYILYGAGDPVTLRSIVRHELSSRIMEVDGVSSVEVLGGDRRAFDVEIEPGTLIRLRIGIDDILALLKRSNRSVIAGYIDRSGREYLIRGDARIRTLGDIRSLPVPLPGGRSVRLGSIAKIREGRVPRHYTVHGDGVPAVAMIVRKQPGASTVRVAEGVERTIRALAHLLPPGTRVKKFYDQSEIIRESQGEILRDLLIGAGLVILVLYLFLGSFRPTWIVALTIPVTFLATLAVLGAAGEGLNMITMTALALAVGMIVDDAIVVMESICRHGSLTSSARDASIEGTLQIAGPDASGTLTTVAAFLPMVIVTGITALFLRPFGITVSAALLVSLALSLTLVPVLAGRSPSTVFRRNGFPGARLIARLDGMLQTVLRFSFRHRVTVPALAVLSLAIAGLLACHSKVSLLPPVDEGAILAEYTMPPGTSLSESNRIGGIAERIALADPDVSSVYRRTGSPGIGYQIEGVNRGELLIKLKPKSARTRRVTEIIRSLKGSYSKLRGAVFIYHQPTQEKIDESFSGLPALFGVTVYGDDMETLTGLAGRVEEILAGEPGISNVVNNTKIKVPEIHVRIEPRRLEQYGVSTGPLLDTIRAARFGIEGTRIIRQKEVVSVRVRIRTHGPLDLRKLRDLPVGTAGGGWVPLKRLAEITIDHAPAAVTRLNGRREITLVAEVEGNIPAAVRRLRKRFRSIPLPEGYSIGFTGQYRVLMKTMHDIILALVTAVLLIYLIMVMQFKSWLQPLIILAAVPLSLAGALAAVFLTGHAIDLSVGMGALTLAGIAVNNGILLIDTANREAASGKDMAGAIIAAASVRLRPILLTSLTTIAALLPSAAGLSAGSRIFQPFAVSVIGGLITATFGTLVVIPTLALSRKLVPDAPTKNHQVAD
ncbi:MAG: efflux RND transporter permease subunit [Deltaproteobacteria bacterium]|nr:efflux RND transporter permease subunit [Deltaproteobacteria bacterium]